MRQIELTQGKVALVDDEDYEYLNKYSWHLTPKLYVRRFRKHPLPKPRNVFMHRQVLGIQFKSTKMQTDHINHNKLDNRKGNLRICTASQNQWNRRVGNVGRSRYKGVAFLKNKNVRPWQAQISVGNKRIYLGQFDSELLAAKVYDKSAIEHFGEFALTNFSKENYV